jgi:peptidoglycan/LPS O-acetylase OafA/YrhL
MNFADVCLPGSVGGSRRGSMDKATGRWPALDGLRAVAVAAVVGFHFGIVPPGWVGVDIFFVISGFLITTLLLEESQRLGRISLRRFWARRALRLGPALLCAIAFALTLSLLCASAARHDTVTGLPWVLLYSGNWVRALGPGTLGLLGHTWSLAIEEQFYFLWPLVCIALVARARNLARAAVVVSGLALADAVYLMFAMQHWGSMRAYYGTDTHAIGLLAGSALALGILSRKSAGRTDGPWQRYFGPLAVISLVIFVGIFAMFSNSQTESALVLIAATLASVVLVARLVLKPIGGTAALFSCSSALWIGKRSYGIYLYHLPIAIVFLERCHLAGVPRAAVLCGCVLLTVLVASASYRWVEAPFLRRKERFTAISAHQTRVGTQVLPAHLHESTASECTGGEIRTHNLAARPQRWEGVPSWR